LEDRTVAFAHRFEYIRPNDLPEAVKILSLTGSRAQILAGGTDLIPWIGEELMAPEILVDIKGIEELAGIVEEDRHLRIGALVTFSELIDSQLIRRSCPVIFETALAVASPGIRNRATLAGNICSAVPSCDGGPALLVHQAEVLVHSATGERRVPMKEWFLGSRKTALQAEEMVTGVRLPVPENGGHGCYIKLGRYRGEDLAQAGVAILGLPEDRWRIAFGAVAPTPVRAPGIESLLSGRKLTGEVIAEARTLVSREIEPITDIRATRRYRLHMVQVMLERGLRAAQDRRESGQPPYGTRLI
jgi:CO/xanthine dehydrogenase FAD-binding subunit